MLEIKGQYGAARVFADTVEEGAAAQIKALCDQEFTADRRIRIMPDVHAGAGCVIGFTADLGERVIPSIVGEDIGCGMLTVELGSARLDFPALDRVIRAHVPSGKTVHEGRGSGFSALERLHCRRALKHTDWLERSLGTLGGGNHFIEVDADEEENAYLVIHTGSRNLGKQVAEYYQELAYQTLKGRDTLAADILRLIAAYKAAGRQTEIQSAIAAMKKAFQEREPAVPRELCYLTGEYRRMYLEDMRICQEFAALNRRTIARTILAHWLGTDLEQHPHFETVHNYIDHDSNIVRKGAVSARAGERLLIPINMRDGSLLCVGKGNPDWNWSAPHGAGRLFSRGAARAAFTVEDFARQMEGIYTTSVGSGTLDECPMAYKSMESIVGNLAPTAEILRVIKPRYNFKAGE